MASKSRAGAASPAKQKIGPYVIERRLGLGGMAEIFLAKKELGGTFGDTALRLVVKRMLPELCEDARFVEMFRREAKILAALRHPNVVRIYDFGTTDKGELFIAMEFLDGISLSALALRAWRGRRAIPIELALRAIAEAARALDHVHGQRDRAGKPLGLIHRDVAPDNLVMLRDGPIKLVDFGVARSRIMERLTSSGEVKGKVPYMAPEVFNGAQLDGRTDLFALGVTGYWLLTGQRPFRGKNDADIMRAILSTEPERPSRHNAALPAWIDELILNLLAKDPDRRTRVGALVAGEIEVRARDALSVQDDVAFVDALLLADVVEDDDGPKDPLPAQPRAPRGYLSSNEDESWELDTAQIKAAAPRSSLSERTARADAPRPISFPTTKEGPAQSTAERTTESPVPQIEQPQVDAIEPPQVDAIEPPQVDAIEPPSSPRPRSISLDLPNLSADGDTVRLTDKELGIAREEFLRTDPKRAAYKDEPTATPDGPTLRQKPPPRRKR